MSHCMIVSKGAQPPNCISGKFVVYMNRDIRNHDNAKKEWTEEELKKLFETHERLLDLVSLFCFVPRAKYLPLGPVRYIIYRLFCLLVL